MIATHNIESLTADQNFICFQVDGKKRKIPINQVSKNWKLQMKFKETYLLYPYWVMEFIGL